MQYPLIVGNQNPLRYTVTLVLSCKPRTARHSKWLERVSTWQVALLAYINVCGNEQANQRVNADTVETFDARFPFSHTNVID